MFEFLMDSERDLERMSNLINHFQRYGVLFDVSFTESRYIVHVKINEK